jgi:hypothetical protein
MTDITKIPRNIIEEFQTIKSEGHNEVKFMYSSYDNERWLLHKWLEENGYLITDAENLGGYVSCFFKPNIRAVNLLAIYDETVVKSTKKAKDEERESKIKGIQVWSIPVTVTVAIIAALFSIVSTGWNITQGNKIKNLEEKMQRIDSLESKINVLENYNYILEWRMKPLEDSLEARYKRDFNEKNILPYMRY